MARRAAGLAGAASALGLLWEGRLAKAGPDGPSLAGLELKEFIEQNRARDKDHLRWIADGGDSLCECPKASDTPREWYKRLVRAGVLEGPHDVVHHLCAESRSWLESHIDLETWGRPQWRTDCEPQIVALCVLCGISLAAKGDETTAMRFFVVALVTLHLALLGCYDRSGWPFLIDEIVENFMRLLEEGSEFRWISPQRPFRAETLRSSGLGLDLRDATEKAGSINLLDQALRLRQAMGMVDSLVYVHQPKVVPEGPGQLANFEALHERGPDLEDWTHADLCGHAWAVLEGREACGGSSSSSAPVRAAAAPRPSSALAAPFSPPRRLVRVLNACSGMFVPVREQYCDPPAGAPGPRMQLEVTSVDRSARAYVAALWRHGWSPRTGLPQQCDVEELWRCFPRGVFDIVHVRNALDHTVRPLQALHELVRVTKPGGRILLWHWWNEHPEAWKGLTSGPHQWAFDFCPTEDVAAASACASLGSTSDPSAGDHIPVLWNYAVAYNLTRELAGKVAFLSARFEEDPLFLAQGRPAGDNRYVVLELRRLPF